MELSRASEALTSLQEVMADLRAFWLRPTVRRGFVDALGVPLDLTTLRVIRAIESLEGSQPGVAEVATTLSVDRSTASRLISRAVDAGLVERSSSSFDRRRVVVSLAPLGVAATVEADRLRDELLREATSEWSERELASLTTLLAKLKKGLEKFDSAGPSV